ncbi:MAG: shufflon system plasmid conjugative transfer pilus tip adhesin PilV [Bacteroidota bacterium]|nr:shufflon system plasmid conjugative transfer pilus tip adhesin PilV [Bacteroidota bacterium]
MKSTISGMLIPRMNEGERDAITSPATSMLIYQTNNTPGYYYNSGTPASPDWIRLFDTDGSDNDWTISGTDMYSHSDITGNVGIGTTTPSYKLHTMGDIYANGGWLRVSDNGGLLFQSHGGGWYMTDATWIRSYGNKNIYHNTGIMRTDGTFQVGSSGSTLNVPNGGDFAYRTSVLFANTSGNVGIGTTSPSTQLHIYISGSTAGNCYEAERVECSGSGEPGILPADDAYGVVGASSTIFSEDRRFWRYYVYDDYYYSSSTEIKSNISDVNPDKEEKYLDKLCHIRSIRFDLNKDVKESTGQTNDGRLIVPRGGKQVARAKKLGVDVASLPPEARDEDGMNVSVSGLQGLMVVSIKALNNKIITLENKISELEKKLSSLND